VQNQTSTRKNQVHNPRMFAECSTPIGPGIIIGRTLDGFLVMHSTKAVAPEFLVKPYWHGGPCFARTYLDDEITLSST
jgi:hypothetical protein